ncbi:MAG: hypothetical protein ACPGXK_02040 [Phycisphaerae bacterium]
MDEKQKTEQTPEHNPRAFVTGTGFVFQGFGGFLLAGSCLIWVLGNVAVPVKAPDADSWGDLMTPEGVKRLTAATGIVTSWVGSLALLATGVGLQGERPRSAGRAQFVAFVLTFIYLACAVLLIVLGMQWLAALVFTVMAAVSVGLLALASRSVQVMKQHPPPEGYNEVTDEWVEEYLQEKRRKRGM